MIEWSEDPRVETISGIITLEDGSTSQFFLSVDGYSQWGANRERLGQTVHVMDALVLGLQEEAIAFADDNG